MRIAVFLAKTGGKDYFTLNMQAAYLPGRPLFAFPSTRHLIFAALFLLELRPAVAQVNVLTYHEDFA